MDRLIQLSFFAMLLTPSACTGPTIQMDLYTWGYSNGEATLIEWTQCDDKSCASVDCLVQTRMDGLIIDQSVYEWDSLMFIGDCWTNECPDFSITHIY